MIFFLCSQSIVMGVDNPEQPPSRLWGMVKKGGCALLFTSAAGFLTNAQNEIVPANLLERVGIWRPAERPVERPNVPAQVPVFPPLVVPQPPHLVEPLLEAPVVPPMIPPNPPNFPNPMHPIEQAPPIVTQIPMNPAELVRPPVIVAPPVVAPPPVNPVVVRQQQLSEARAVLRQRLQANGEAMLQTQFGSVNNATRATLLRNLSGYINDALSQTSEDQLLSNSASPENRLRTRLENEIRILTSRRR